MWNNKNKKTEITPSSTAGTIYGSIAHDEAVTNDSPIQVNTMYGPATPGDVATYTPDSNGKYGYEFKNEAIEIAILAPATALM